MKINPLTKRLEVWKRILFIIAGASVTLVTQAVLKYLESRSLTFESDWYGVWSIVQLAAFLPGFILLWGKHWMQIPLAERLNTAFGYFALTWFTFLPVGIRIEHYESKTINFVLIGCAIAMAISYWLLRRKSMDVREIFP